MFEHFTNWIAKDPVWLVVFIGTLGLTVQIVGPENIKRKVREWFSRKRDQEPPDEPLPEEPEKHWLFVRPKLPRTQIRFRL